jgi:serine/threonine protein kinase/outer membrane protein assembly factor BamB/tetratricopeptide (TPR) repeat protein
MSDGTGGPKENVPPALEATRIAGATPAPAATAETRERLGPYRLLKRLGGGGMGHIFLAVQESVGRQVALKVLPPGSMDGTAVERFQREIQVLGQLQHPNICPVLEAGVADGTHYYAMEYLRGMDVSRVLRTQRVDPRRAAEIAVQVARALHFSHGRGIIHRDIKPLNIMLVRGHKARAASASQAPGTSLGPLKRWFGRKGSSSSAAAPSSTSDAPTSAGEAHDPSPEFEDHAFLIDFGLARDGESKGTRLTVSGEILGTPAYMAPEQARGESRSISARTDVYSLGATLYELLTLASPFTGQNPGEILHKVLYDDPVPPRLLSPFIDRDLETIVQKAMEKEPARRYETAEAMAVDLERWLAGEPILARRASLLYRIRRRIARNRLASTGVAALAGATGLGVYLLFLAPGSVDVIVREPATATVRVDGKAYGGGRMRVWPPGRHTVVIEAEGFLPQSHSLQVGPGDARSLDVRLKSAFGKLSVDTDPPGAEVIVDERVLGTSPLERNVEIGKRALRIRLADHALLEESAEIMPGVATAISRKLVHDKGSILVTSEPGPASLWLKRVGSNEEIRTPSSEEPVPLPTGRWAGLAQARNCFPVRLAFTVSRDKAERVHTSPQPMTAWETRTDAKSKALAAADLDGDGWPDVVVMSRDPRRVRALSGATGRLLWMIERADIPDVDIASLSVADFDGDLRPEICLPDFRGRILVLKGEDGTLQATLEAGGTTQAFRVGDLDGDGLDDLVASGRDAFSAWNVREGRRVWSVSAEGTFGAVAAAHLRPARGPDIVLVEQGKGTRALDGRTGDKLWSAAAGSQNPPISVDTDGDGLEDLLAVTYRNATLIRGTDGKILATAGGAFHGRAPGALGGLRGDGRLELVQNGEGFLEILDPATCTSARRVPLAVSWSPPVLADVNRDGALDIIAASDDRLVFLDGRDLKELWSYAAKARIYDAPLLGDFDGDGRQDVVYADESGNVALVRAEPPDLLWKQAAVAWSLEAPAPVGNPPRALVLPGEEMIRVLRASDGAVLASIPSLGARSAFPVRLEGADAALVSTEGDSRLLEVAASKVRWEVRPGFRTAGVLVLDSDGDGVPELAGGDPANGESPFAVLDARTGQPRWKSAVAPTPRARLALAGGVYWVPSKREVAGLRASDGADAGRIEANGTATSVTGIEDDLVFGNTGGEIFRVKPPSRGLPAQLVWHSDAKAALGATSPVVLDGLAVAVTVSGSVVALEASTGRELWRHPLGDEVLGGPSLADLDGDGRPEVAVATSGGLLTVLRGADGAPWWNAGREGRWGPVVPLWADLDGDGTPELVAQNRNGYAYAWRVRPMRPTVLWPDRTVRSASEAVRVSARADDERQARSAVAGGRDPDLFAAAKPARSAVACALAARAAKRRGDAAAAAAYASRARALGCRLLEVRLLELAFLPPGEAPREFAWSLLEAPTEELLDPPTDPGLAEIWRSAASLLGPASGREDRALLAIGALGSWDEITAAFDRFASKGADRPHLLMARGRLAFRLERDADAIADFTAALPEPDAVQELARLAELGETLRQRGIEAGLRKNSPAALTLLRRAARLRPDDPGPLNELAFFGATLKDCTPELARECVAAAERAVALHKRRAPADRGTLAWYLDTLAAAWFAAGDASKALKIQREAMALPYPRESEKEMTDRLRKYEAAAGK